MVILSNEEKRAIKLRLKTIGRCSDNDLIEMVQKTISSKLSTGITNNGWTMTGETDMVNVTVGNNIGKSLIVVCEVKKHETKDIAEEYSIVMDYKIEKSVSKDISKLLNVEEDETTEDWTGIRFSVKGSITLMKGNNSFMVYSTHESYDTPAKSTVNDSIRLIEQRVSEITRQLRRLAKGKQYELKKHYDDTAHVETETFTRSRKYKTFTDQYGKTHREKTKLKKGTTRYGTREHNLVLITEMTSSYLVGVNSNNNGKKLREIHNWYIE